MPRPFTDAERKEIHARLIATARAHFGDRGYRKANVAEIARDAGIGKGSVYLFFDSKAALFMSVAEVVETEVREAFLRDARDRSLPTARERLEHLFAFHVRALDRDPFLHVALDPEETASLFREMPPAVAESHRQADVAFFEEILASWTEEGASHAIDARVLAEVLRALYVILLHRELIGSEDIEQLLDLCGEGVARTLTEGWRCES